MCLDYTNWCFDYAMRRVRDLDESIRKKWPDEKLSGLYYDLGQALICLNRASELYRSFLKRREQAEEAKRKC